MSAKSKLILILLLAGIAYLTNPQVEDFQHKANELFAEQVNRAAAQGNLTAKLGKVLGAQNLGEFVIRIERHDYYMLSYGDVFSTIDDSFQGTMIGIFGQVFTFPSKESKPIFKPQ